MKKREKVVWRPAIRILPAMPLEILLHHRPPVVSMRREGDEHFFICSAGPYIKTTIHDEYMGKNVYEIRDKFFLVRTPSEAFDFLSSYSFFLEPPDNTHELTISWTHFQKWQQLLGLIALHGFPFIYEGETVAPGPYFFPNLPLPEELRDFYSKHRSLEMPDTTLDNWLRGRATHLDIGATTERIRQLQPEREAASCKVHVASIVEAILATIYFNEVIGITYERCQRDGCDQIFEITTNHDRRFCSKKCAHTQGTRDRRAAAAALAREVAAKNTAKKKTVRSKNG